MAGLGAATLRRAKRALAESQRLPLADGLAFERELLLEAYGHPEATRGISAFLARRGGSRDKLEIGQPD